MSAHPRFMMLGGFLGAGKTTTIARLARHYQSLGKNVAIVTNDQATDLVDTNLLRSQGFDVGEVAGSCFCCNFNELTATIERLAEHQLPNIVLAEPVGSCTDLVATVIRPLQQLYDKPFEIAPYGVLLKPSHGLKILKGRSHGGFSPQAEYIFRKQIEEADFLAINRIDELADEMVAEITSLVEAQFPDLKCLRISAVTGQGFEDLYQEFDRAKRSGSRAMEVDYDVYAQGEAELGWLNAQLEVTSLEPFLVDDWLMTLLDWLQTKLNTTAAEIAHLKAIAMAEGAISVVNLVSSDSQPRLSLPSRIRVMKSEMVINARVAISPEELTSIVRAGVSEVDRRFATESEIRTLQSFRPGRPVPTHRL